MPASDEDLQPLVAAGYVALANLLATSPDTAWDTPSLCEGWRVREVVAHLTMPVRYSEEAFMAELRDCQFDSTLLSNVLAARDADRPIAELIGNLRDEVMRNWSPPGGGYHGALNHVVIHGLDVTVPLGKPRCSTDEAIRVVLDDLTEAGGHAHFGTDISGLGFQTDDIEWSFGSGQVLTGSAQDLALYLCGRAVPNIGQALESR